MSITILYHFSHQENPIFVKKILLLLVVLSLIISNCISTPMPFKHLQDQKLMGDLNHMRSTNIYSLSWLIKLSSGCTVNKILIECSCNDEFWNRFSNKKKSKLMILKKLAPFMNIFLIAHPYYRMYNKVKRKLKNIYKKNIMHRNLHMNISQLNFGNNFYLSRNIPSVSNSKLFFKTEKCVNKCLEAHSCIEIVKQEVLRPRSKRAKVEFDDPLYKDQWHLNNSASGEYDVNVIGAWESGITGHGVTVCVIDDGLEWRHPDLRDNYNPRGSYDLNAEDFDPSPVKNGENNEHGTRCAGEIAAVANNVCGVGVAYRANISGIRVLGERMTDSMEAAAFVQGLAVNDIYSCSWGPNDDGKTVDGPRYLAKRALLHGVTYGRNGYGAIYVVASGNGGKNKDNCNFDGYANSAFTVTIGAVDSKGSMPYYAEECATMLAVTPSSGNNGKAIVTTDWQGSSKTGCTFQHSGTSAAAPLAAAVISLALEMQPCLSWRDVQYLIALTSRKIDSAHSDWVLSRSGLQHSHKHGFGLMDATALVSAAAVWESVPFSTWFRSRLRVLNKAIPETPFRPLVVNHTVGEELLRGFALHLLEFVQVYVTLEHEVRGSLRIGFRCPSGTTSILASPREKDNSSQGLQHWPLGTVRCWGEEPAGVYTLTVEHTHRGQLVGKLVSMQLVLHGSPMTQAQFQARRRLVKRAIKGEVIHVNRSRLCHAPETNFDPVSTLSDQTMKILVITGVFLFLMAIYNTAEYVFCYNAEKKRFYAHLRDLVRSRSMMLSKRARTSVANSDLDESLTLLEESRQGDSLPGESLSDSRWQESHLESPLNGVLYDFCAVSPTPSCEADVSSLNADSEDDDHDTISSRNTSDTVVPRDTDVTGTTTDFTTDHTTSEPDELDRK